jgi:ribosomal protein S18 acetylase RimI-like enzyme
MELIDDRLAKKTASEYSFVVALHNAEIVGYCCYGLIPCSVHSFDLYWIVVDQTRRRSGIGRKIVAAVEEQIKAVGGKLIYIDTSSRADYEPTRRFYHACGYKVEATFHDYYAPGDGKVVLSKALA